MNLSIPMQRMCSEEKMGSQYCDNDVLDMLRKGEEIYDVNKFLI